MAISRTLRFQILRRDNHTCQSCGRSAPEVRLEVDHVLPEALGGRTEASNLRALCSDCNGGKSATPPDAAIVAGVSADALRWASAQRTAAERMLADLKARAQDREAFDEAWSRWSIGNSKEPIPRDDDWPNSVDHLLSAGLPLPVLLDCIEKTMRNKNIPAGRAFRYMCGMAWRRVQELNDAASEITSEPLQTDPPASRVAALADEVVQWADEADHRRLMDEAFIEAPVEVDDNAARDSYNAQLIQVVVRDLYGTKSTYRNRAQLLMNKLPEEIRDRVLHEAKGILLCAGQEDHTEDDLLSVALTTLGYEIERYCHGGTDWPEATGVA